jgi:hypothetical protein
MRPVAWYILATFLCAGNAFAAWPRLNDKLTAKDGKLTIRKVVILPAQVTFEKVGAKGSESSLPEGEQMAANFYSAVSKELAARGLAVLPNPMAEAKDDAARYAIADLQAKYDNIAVQLRRKSKRVKKGGFTLGDRVATFEPGAAADTLVFIRGTGVTFTKGRQAIGLATWNVFSVLAHFTGELAFVDARTGEVLAFVWFVSDPHISEKSQLHLANDLRNAIEPIPLPLPPPKR